MTLDVGKYGGSTFWSDYQTALKNGNASLAKQYEQIIADPAQSQGNQDFRQALVREGMILNDQDGRLAPAKVAQYVDGVAHSASIPSDGGIAGGELSSTEQAARLAWHNFRLSGGSGHIFDQKLPGDEHGVPIAALQEALDGANTARAENISTADMKTLLATLDSTKQKT